MNRYGRCRRVAGWGCATATRRCARWSGCRARGTDMAARHRERAVAGQPVAPVDKTDPQCVAGQERPEPGAIEEKVAVDDGVVGQVDALDKPVVGAKAYVADGAFDPADVARLGIAAQELGVERGIEMIGISDMRQHRSRIGIGKREAARLRGDGALAIRLDRVRIALRAAAQPILVEIDPLHVDAMLAKRVDVAVAAPRPVDELDPQLEGRLSRRHELGFVDAEHLVERQYVGNRRLAHPDGADGVGFDERDRHFFRVEQARQRSRRHPPGRSTADDHDSPQKRGLGHRALRSRYCSSCAR